MAIHFCSSPFSKILGQVCSEGHKLIKNNDSMLDRFYSKHTEDWIIIVCIPMLGSHSSSVRKWLVGRVNVVLYWETTRHILPSENLVHLEHVNLRFLKHLLQPLITYDDSLVRFLL